MKKDKEEKKENKEPNKFIKVIKSKWLIKGTSTALLVAAIICIYVAIVVFLNSLDLEPIDLSEDKLYTLSDEVKQKIENADINQDVKMYFFGSTEDDENLKLAKQFNNINGHITAEAVDVNERKDLAEKYGLSDGVREIIIECGERVKGIETTDLMTYDMESGESINIADEKLANSIVSLTLENVPKVYFLEGYSDFSLISGKHSMSYLAALLANEITEIDTFNIITTGKVPDDCDTLIIQTPNRDFDDATTTAIEQYIDSGKNIIWFNAAITKKIDTPNVNKILAKYGVNPFEVGYILETDNSKMAVLQQQAYPNLIIPSIQQSKATKNIYNTSGILLLNATKINLENEDKLKELKVESTNLISSSENSYFTANLNGDVNNSGAEKKSYTIGVELDKTIQEENQDENKPAVESKMVLIGENYFITDDYITYQYNKRLPLDTIAYLSDREEDIVSRKSMGNVTYTATQQENTIILILSFGAPVLIVIIGIVVWIRRRRKK